MSGTLLEDANTTTRCRLRILGFADHSKAGKVVNSPGLLNSSAVSMISDQDAALNARISQCIVSLAIAVVTQVLGKGLHAFVHILRG